jgi:hypothetical protein
MSTREAALDDKLAINRALPITAAESIPTPPEGYQPTEPDKRVARLKKVARSGEAELLDALQECAALGPKLPQLLGEYAPSGEEAAPIAEELTQVQSTLARLYALAGYLEERKAILLSDGRGFVELVMREFEHHIDRKIGLGATFKDTAKFSRSIGEAISEGIAEAKRQKAAEAARAEEI